jgi:hypothetical protein
MPHVGAVICIQKNGAKEKHVWKYFRIALKKFPGLVSLRVRTKMIENPVRHAEKNPAT